MLGDPPLPADEEKERQLEVVMVRLREYRRQGLLDSDRNTPSWQEYRRRKRQRRSRDGRGAGEAREARPG